MNIILSEYILHSRLDASAFIELDQKKKKIDKKTWNFFGNSIEDEYMVKAHIDLIAICNYILWIILVLRLEASISFEKHRQNHFFSSIAPLPDVFNSIGDYNDVVFYDNTGISIQ